MNYEAGKINRERIFESIVRELQAKNPLELDVYDYGKEGEERGPFKTNANDAIQRLRSRTKAPVNMLNVPVYEANPLVGVTSDVPEYDLLGDIQREATLRGVELPTDLSESTTVRLMASPGAVTRLHIDRHHLLTRVAGIVGRKLWFACLRASAEVLKAFADSGKIPSKLVAFLAEGGTTIEQPGGTIHGVLTMFPREALFDCSMHMHRHMLPDILKQTHLAVRNPDITNEGFADEFIPAMQIAISLSRMESPAEWPSVTEMNECEADFEMIKEEISRQRGGQGFQSSQGNRKRRKRR
ncbi:hypothetical protein EDB80DRAFT_626443 [Ilyonectria destructans]|nr:hypothetical protein EDB80DRAFT_626443 [Ilyonectria destructans]